MGRKGIKVACRYRKWRHPGTIVHEKGPVPASFLWEQETVGRDCLEKWNGHPVVHFSPWFFSHDLDETRGRTLPVHHEIELSRTNDPKTWADILNLR
ncbi:hypothetical protein TNCV_1089001 [Trichonephila clavipes]|uniref:Uncharacterized protein n=1 Tax=Trichonephila clavipes TaxID=2585209 RepID=A0A8X6VQE0_TRICX|nr:hypothetical protein TNCV_1089001 [Trichonephila clavipes]